MMIITAKTKASMCKLLSLEQAEYVHPPKPPPVLQSEKHHWNDFQN